jgi:hypothetical protein
MKIKIGMCCGICWWYIGGKCKCDDSAHYGEIMSKGDLCGWWEEKKYD